jgi:hypothetical protein
MLPDSKENVLTTAPVSPSISCISFITNVNVTLSEETATEGMGFVEFTTIVMG